MSPGEWPAEVAGAAGRCDGHFVILSPPRSSLGSPEEKNIEA